MPYEIRDVDGQFCVYKQTGGESLGCHARREDAQAQIAAIESNEKELKARTYIYRQHAADRRLMLIVTSNAYRDREGEIVSQKALEGYVERSWQQERFVGTNPLLVWHAGDPIGDIVYADTEGPFLIEVARERPNAIVNLAAPGEPPVHAEIKSVWDALEREKELGASHMFGYQHVDREDRVYDDIIKMETSVLPREAAANFFTDSEILRERAYDEP